LQSAIDAANAKKRQVESEHAPALAASSEARAASEAAATASEEKKAGLDSAKAAVKDAKAALEAADENARKADAELLAPAANKERAERLSKDLKDSASETSTLKSCVADAKYLARTFELDEHFTRFLASTLSKPTEWRTFDKLVVKEFEEELAKVIVRLNGEIAAAAPVKAARIAELEAATSALAAAEEAVKGATEAAKAAALAAGEAATAAKTAAATAKAEISLVDKAAKSCTDAEGALAAFKAGALAAYVEVEASAKPIEPAIVEEPAPAEAGGAAVAPA